MKERLTVTVDAALAAQARQAAHDRGESVSGLMEGVLRAALSQRTRRSSGFADRWLGKFSVGKESSNDSRLTALKAKHRLP